MPVICHVWPGITPFNIWDLPMYQWRLFRQEADSWLESQRGMSDGR